MKVLIVDDDRTLADIIAFTFKREGFEVILAEDGEKAYQSWKNDNPDLIILDVNIPKVDGFSVCKRIREQSDIPIILLTVRSDEEDILGGFSIGADDYITKPFSPRQLMARVKAVLRRSKKKAPVTTRNWGKISLNLNRYELQINNNSPIQLSGLELRLMDCLMINIGQIVTAEIIIDHVWGSQGGDMDMVRQLVHRLRVKIEKNSVNQVFINNVPGLGYELLQNETD
ncbi:MAG: DNA-binding response regulator [Chloroflexi bacterium HGW-Chloroflexi-10]|nr:MAG: DNA-binding response regulator [Chloroflexi bacterium HGW-Chloroflexi-10]